MDSKGLAIACLIGFFVGFMIVQLGKITHQTEQTETKKEINLSGIEKISKHKNYSVVRKINDSTTIFLDSTVWYEDQEMN
jgi:uncharacterized membrane-anchored protein YhcB (DUF1043 family)